MSRMSVLLACCLMLVVRGQDLSREEPQEPTEDRADDNTQDEYGHCLTGCITVDAETAGLCVRAKSKTSYWSSRCSKYTIGSNPIYNCNEGFGSYEMDTGKPEDTSYTYCGCACCLNSDPRGHRGTCGPTTVCPKRMLFFDSYDIDEDCERSDTAEGTDK